MKIQNVPPLEGYVNLVEAAEILGISRQHSGRFAASGAYKTLRQVGSKQVFVVKTSEVEALKATRRASPDVADGTSFG